MVVRDRSRDLDPRLRGLVRHPEPAEDVERRPRELVRC